MMFVDTDILGVDQAHDLIEKITCIVFLIVVQLVVSFDEDRRVQ